MGGNLNMCMVDSTKGTRDVSGNKKYKYQGVSAGERVREEG